MIYLILKSYLTILLPIITVAMLLFFTGVYFLFTKNEPKPFKLDFNSIDMNAIAGDDVIHTQLDLARAYMETGRDELAKKMLSNVIAQGNMLQREEAKDLLNSLCA